ncbi:MAG: serine/threonine protein kinase [Deltaproteobacteria bacterium]|nr:serine/threonine protein kinase [Deltaproteobacteria bacterium]
MSSLDVAHAADSFVDSGGAAFHTRSNVTHQLQEPIQFGKYTLYERIGRGGMADVFKGRIQGPSGFERVFVVKRILPHLSDDPAFIRMFVEEAKLSARLNHPNIVQIFELGSVDSELFISMEHVPGHDLAETMRALWKSSGAPRPELVAYIGREICRALGYAHGVTDDQGQSLGMIHRDVSPSNVMLSFEGAVKLLDFGIAKALSDAPEVTKSGTLKGKYAYMAPEQTEGDHVDHRIDIFAAGIVMHEVLTGRRLFKGNSDLQTIEKVRRCEVRPPSQLNPACPPILDEILLRALARDPNDRFQSADALADALDDVVHAAHFTPPHMAAILREAFGMEGSGNSGPIPDRRPASSTSPSISTVTASAGRSPTVPPIALSTTRPSTRLPALVGSAPSSTDLLAVGSLVARPPWRRASFWIVALLCAGGIGVGVVNGVRRDVTGGATIDRNRNSGLPAASSGQASMLAGPSPNTPPTRKLRNVPVLIQSEPEGAEIYATGRLESLGTTPKWVTLQLDPATPARVMIRKAGFQDKAIAIEAEKPPTVHLIPIGAPAPAVETTKDRAWSGDQRSTRPRGASKKTKGLYDAPAGADDDPRGDFQPE